MKRKGSRQLVVLVVLATAVALALALGSSSSAHRTPLASALPRVVVGPLGPNGALPPGVDPPTCTAPDGTEFRCYTPALLQEAYSFPTGNGAPTGRGQTIVVVDAFGSPTIQDDLAAFDSDFGVPAPPSFTIVGPNGSGDPEDPNVQGWQLETSLDVEYAHAMAPGANIVLVVASSDDNSDINQAEAAAVQQYPGAIFSHSWGSDETDDVPSNVELHRIFVRGQRMGDTFVAGTGDFGATDGGSKPIAAYPASDPLVTSVGGTMGLPYPNGLLRDNQRSNRGFGQTIFGHDSGRATSGYGNEQVWNEPDFGVATGGAPSVLFPAPFWQRGVSNLPTRATPDVAYNAAINGGVLVAFGGGLTLFGGTSVGSPGWASIFALVNEARAAAHRRPLGFANNELYGLARDFRQYRQDFHDIVVGNNALDGPGFHARPGYDLATGLGTPNVTNLINDLSGRSGGPGDDPGEPGHGQQWPRAAVHHRLPGR
jgi:subtilase family serine protease